MNQFTAYIPLKPVSTNEARCVNRGRLQSTQRNNSFKSNVRQFLCSYSEELEHFSENLMGGVSISGRIIFWIPNSKLFTKKGLISKTSGDWDNGIKSFQDAVFNSIKHHNKNIDDSQVMKCFVEKRLSQDDKFGITILLYQI